MKKKCGKTAFTAPPAMIRSLLATLALAVTASAAQPPNIVFIFCDDLAYQAMSCYGDKRKLLETPNIDRLAKEGMRFDRCLVTNSICGPMRAVIQTGKYSHANGFYNNSNSKFDSSQPTFPKVLQKSGYQTAVIGKWHLMTDPVGYDYWNVLPGQGAYYNPPMTENGKQVKYEGYCTDIIGDLTLKWLDERASTKLRIASGSRRFAISALTTTASMRSPRRFSMPTAAAARP
jgi:arylsulfatase A-like enzyme